MPQNKSIKRNVFPSQALAASSTTTSANQQSFFERGVRLYLTISAVTAGGGTDTVFLCAVAPGTVTPIPLAGFSAANLLSTVGTFIVDFYPSGQLSSTNVASNAKFIGVHGVTVPVTWAVQLKIGAGNAATIVVDAELLP